LSWSPKPESWLGLDGGKRGDRGPILVVEPGGVRLAGLEPRRPIGLGELEVHLGEVTVGDADRGPGGGPGPLRGEREFLRLDLLYEVATELSAGTVGELLNCPHGDLTGFDKVVVLAGDLSESLCSLGRALVVIGPREKALERIGLAVGDRHVAGIDRHARRPEDAVEVGAEKCRTVDVGRMEVEQRSIEPGRMENRRIGVGGSLLVLGLPRPKIVGTAESRTRRLQLKSILGVGEPTLA